MAKGEEERKRVILKAGEGPDLLELIIYPFPPPTHSKVEKGGGGEIHTNYRKLELRNLGMACPVFWKSIPSPRPIAHLLLLAQVESIVREVQMVVRMVEAGGQEGKAFAFLEVLKWGKIK